ncbi:synaptotagmin-8 isoform X2 [Oryctolagus cuniculus]|uniref:synaptotagmin-8 isoform X2 n=1 Tax=Oryctolagus cuniculus TaxID=9986 RepID=UPI003879B61F
MGRTAGTLLTGDQERQGLGQPRWPHGHRQSGPQEPARPLEEYALHRLQQSRGHPARCPLSLARSLGQQPQGVCPERDPPAAPPVGQPDRLSPLTHSLVTLGGSPGPREGPPPRGLARLPAVRWGCPQPGLPHPLPVTRGSAVPQVDWPQGTRGPRGQPGADRRRSGHQTAGGRMGQPTETPGAPATAGTTTALPGLIPDLVSRIHWPRWALVVLALAAGALVLSCIVCAVCCCRRRQRRRKKPGDKEAVGLGSARSTTTTHPVQPEVDDLESGLQPWGRLQLSLEYDPAAQELKVGLRQAAALKAAGTVDCYARASVSTQPGHRHETRVHHDTPCPVFDETCCFHVPRAELPRASVRVQLFNFRRFSEHEPLGELLLPLGSEDLQHVLERWHQLGPPGSAEPLSLAAPA